MVKKKRSVKKKETSKSLLPNEVILKKIIFLRGEKVMMDLHLTELYGVETRILKQAVRRNPERFPPDLLFRLNRKEMNEVVSQNVIPHKKYFGGAVPYAFTETGVAMLSSVLKSKKAISVNLLNHADVRCVEKNVNELQRSHAEIAGTGISL